MSALNINDTVWVELTRDGRRIYAEHHAQFAHLGITAPQPAHGWVQFQLWGLMEIFGPHCGLGLPGLIQRGEIRLTDPNEEAA